MVLVLAQSVTENFWRYQPHPEVWVLVLGLAGLYVYALRSIGPGVVGTGNPVATAANKRWFAVGLVLLWLASDWPVHDISEKYLYSVHMVQHIALMFVIPPVMLLATPEWLARLLVGNGRSGRAFMTLARPIPAATAFAALQLLSHWTVVVNLSANNGPFHYALHAAMVLTALAVWMSVVSPIPEARITPPGQCVLLFLVSIVPTVPAGWLVLAEGVLYDAYDKPARMFGISVTADQQVAGLIMKLGGGMWLWLLIIIIFFRWHAGQDKGITPRKVRTAPDGTVLEVEDPPRTLLYDDVERAFQRAVDVPSEPPAEQDQTVT